MIADCPEVELVAGFISARVLLPCNVGAYVYGADKECDFRALDALAQVGLEPG